MKEEKNSNFHSYDRRTELLFKRINPVKNGFSVEEYRQGRKVKPKVLTPRNIELLEKYFIDKTNEGLTKPRVLALLEQTSTMLEWLNKDWDSVDKEDVKVLVNKIRSLEYTEHTITDYLGKLKQFDKWFSGEEEYTDKTKWIKATMKQGRQKLPNDLLTPEEAKRIYEATDNVRDRAILHLLWETGARIGELANLKTQDIQFSKGEAYLNLFGKTGARRVFILESVRDLKNYLDVRPKKVKHDFVFMLQSHKNVGKPLSYHATYKMLNEVVVKAGVNKKVHPHLFRHSRASFLASQGLNEAQKEVCFFYGRGKKNNYCLNKKRTILIGINGIIEKPAIIVPIELTKVPFGVILSIIIPPTKSKTISLFKLSHSINLNCLKPARFKKNEIAVTSIKITATTMVRKSCNIEALRLFI
jgi:site-specific recombinase XerD